MKLLRQRGKMDHHWLKRRVCPSKAKREESFWNLFSFYPLLPLWGFLALLPCLLGGCARTPPGAQAQTNRLMVVQFSVRGQINPDRYYFFLLDLSDDTSNGPIPVVSPPWGNGFGAGRFTYYVRWDRFQPGFAGIYRVEPGSSLLASTFIGRPLNINFTPGSNTVQFTLDLGQLEVGPFAQVRQANINFIATDIIPQDPNFRGRKLVDALGASGNDYVTISTSSTRLFRNADLSRPETSGDVIGGNDPDLDIVDWQIEIRIR